MEPLLASYLNRSETFKAPLTDDCNENVFDSNLLTRHEYNISVCSR